MRISYARKGGGWGRGLVFSVVLEDGTRGSGHLYAVGILGTMLQDVRW
jgi:hypothetical protein